MGCGNCGAIVVEGRALPMRTFMKLFVEFILSLEETGGIGNVGELPSYLSSTVSMFTL